MSQVSQSVAVTVNGKLIEVHSGSTVAVAILQAGAASRHSVQGTLRQPLCGMGICYECRARIDGHAYQRTCQIVCRPGMQVVTG